MRIIPVLSSSVKLISVIFILLVSACNDTPDEPLRVGAGPWPGYEPLYLARDLGFLKESKVNIFELPSSDITMESFRNHSTDVAAITLDETIELLSEGTKLRILTVMDVSHGGDAVLVRPEIKKLSDIKGKKVSIVNIPLGLYMLNRLLDIAGVSRNDIEVFPMAETKQEKFYKDGKADVVITFEPVKTRLKKLGANVIFDSSMIPNEIFDLLVVHEDVYLSRKDDLCEITAQWFKTLQYMKDNHADAAKRVTHRLGLEISDYDGLLDGIIQPDIFTNKKLLGGEKPGLIEPGERLSKVMIKEKQLKVLVDVNEAIDTSFTSCY